MIRPHSILTLVIAILAMVASRKTPFVHLAHARLTSPVALLHQLFGPVESSRTWREDGLGVFAVESEADRLMVGPVKTGQGDSAFGVTRMDG